MTPPPILLCGHHIWKLPLIGWRLSSFPLAAQSFYQANNVKEEAKNFEKGKVPFCNSTDSSWRRWEMLWSKKSHSKQRLKRSLGMTVLSSFVHSPLINPDQPFSQAILGRTGGVPPVWARHAGASYSPEFFYTWKDSGLHLLSG